MEENHEKKVEEIVSNLFRGIPIERKNCKCGYDLKGFEVYCPMCGKKAKRKKREKK